MKIKEQYSQAPKMLQNQQIKKFQDERCWNQMYMKLEHGSSYFQIHPCHKNDVLK